MVTVKNKGCFQSKVSVKNATQNTICFREYYALMTYRGVGCYLRLKTVSMGRRFGETATTLGRVLPYLDW